MPLRKPPQIKSPGCRAWTVNVMLMKGGKLALLRGGVKDTHRLFP